MHQMVRYIFRTYKSKHLCFKVITSESGGWGHHYSVAYPTCNKTKQKNKQLRNSLISKCMQYLCSSFQYYASIVLPSNTGYWISFQDGLQRVVLFTTSHRICSHVLEGNKMEQNYIELSLSLQAVGLSLVNDIKGLEIAYIGIPQYVLLQYFILNN